MSHLLQEKRKPAIQIPSVLRVIFLEGGRFGTDRFRQLRTLVAEMELESKCSAS